MEIENIMAKANVDCSAKANLPQEYFLCGLFRISVLCVEKLEIPISKRHSFNY